MPIYSPSILVEPNGGYVVARPEKTDAIGGILRASFRLGADDAGDEMAKMLAMLDRPDLLS